MVAWRGEKNTNICYQYIFNCDPVSLPVVVPIFSQCKQVFYRMFVYCVDMGNHPTASLGEVNLFFKFPFAFCADQSQQSQEWTRYPYCTLSVCWQTEHKYNCVKCIMVWEQAKGDGEKRRVAQAVQWEAVHGAETILCAFIRTACCETSFIGESLSFKRFYRC